MRLNLCNIIVALPVIVCFFMPVQNADVPLEYPFEKEDNSLLEKTVSELLTMESEVPIEKERAAKPHEPKASTFKCPQKHGTWPVLEDCRSFITCTDGVAMEHQCQDYLSYNIETKLCDYSNNTNCPYQCKSDGEFPLYGDCNAFIKCEKNIPTLKICDPGKHWNRYRNVCEAPEIAKCPLKCPQENGTFPFVGDCSSYVMCWFGLPQEKKCPQGLFYNRNIHSCAPKKDVFCSYEFKCPYKGGRHPVLDDCNMYLQCREDVPLNHYVTLELCPDNMFYNPTTQECGLANETICANQCPEPDGIFSIPGLCNNYKICTDGVSSLHSCSPNFHFDSLEEMCNLKSDAGCEAECGVEDAIAIPGTCNMYIDCNRDPSKLKYCSGNLHWNHLTKECDFPTNANCKLVCPEKDGIFPILGQCSDYILCADGKPLRKRCSKGLQFNAETQQCDFTKNVHCNPICPKPNGRFPLESYGKEAYMDCKDNRARVNFCQKSTKYDSTLEKCVPISDDFPLY